MDINYAWENLDWTIQACKFLLGLDLFPKELKIILLLRHSERDELRSVWEPQELLLTPQGHNMAIKFGETLPTNRPIRLFTSLAPRCQDTAQSIFKGFKVQLY